MTVTIKTPDDIEKMRIAGRLAAEVLEMIGEHIKPGVTSATTISSTSRRRFPPR